MQENTIRNSITLSSYVFNIFLTFIILKLFLLIKRKHFAEVTFIAHVRLAVLGIVGIALFYYFYFKGLYYSSAFNAGLLEATIPLVTLGISVLIGEEAFGIENTIGFIIAYIGVNGSRYGRNALHSVVQREELS